MGNFAGVARVVEVVDQILENLQFLVNFAQEDSAAVGRQLFLACFDYERLIESDREDSGCSFTHWVSPLGVLKVFYLVLCHGDIGSR